MPFAKYNLHATRDCTNNGKYQSYMSGNAASREEGKGKDKYKRERVQEIQQDPQECLGTIGVL